MCIFIRTGAPLYIDTNRLLQIKPSYRQKASTTALERRASMVNASRLQSTEEPISLIGLEGMIVSVVIDRWLSELVVDDWCRAVVRGARPTT